MIAGAVEKSIRRKGLLLTKHIYLIQKPLKTTLLQESSYLFITRRSQLSIEVTNASHVRQNRTPRPCRFLPSLCPPRITTCPPRESHNMASLQLRSHQRHWKRLYVQLPNLRRSSLRRLQHPLHGKYCSSWSWTLRPEHGRDGRGSQHRGCGWY